MASSSSFRSLYLQLSLTAIAILLVSTYAIAASPSQNHRAFTKIYAFGDSFTDTGNTRTGNGPAGFGYVSNSPYGITFFKRPTNRYSDGRLVIDFVTQSLNLPFLPPYLAVKNNKNGHIHSASNGVNFAVAGSTAINHAFFVNNNLSLAMTPQSIQTQLIWFDRYLETLGCKERVSAPECRRVFDDALFWVGEIGVNDYAYIIGSSVSSDTVRKLAVSSSTQVLEALLKRGAKYMVVQGLPPTGCLTLAMSLAAEDDRDDVGCVKSANNQSYTHNLALHSKLQQLRIRFPEATIVYADYWNAYHTVVQNPVKYGFKERFKACCGTGEPYNFQVFETCGTPSATVCKNPSQYINWDGVHLTEAMYNVMANMFLNGSFSQPSFRSLLVKKQGRG